jgi:hypothetical protein
MIRGHGRSAADLPPRDALPARPTGTGLRMVLAVLLGTLGGAIAFHLAARIFA